MGLKSNPTKITLTAFAKGKLNLKEIGINGEIFEWKTDVKYLRLILHDKLHWNKHEKNFVSKATKHLMVFKNFGGKNWECNPRILRWMYTAIVGPFITYKIVASGSGASLNRTRSNPSKIQRLACVYITGAMGTCVRYAQWEV